MLFPENEPLSVQTELHSDGRRAVLLTSKPPGGTEAAELYTLLEHLFLEEIAEESPENG